MNLSSFTKKLAEKICLYDDIYRDTFSGIKMINPFANGNVQPLNVTVIWVDRDCEKD